jgi:hypothetical protein
VTAAAAPFGTWNEGLRAALRATGMTWSSEFGRLHDDVPCEISGRSDDAHEPWQVPVHPVCPGLLLQRGLGEREVAAYFVARLEECLDRGDPAVFYGHPIGELERLPSLFVELDRALSGRPRPVWRATLGELLEFERARRAQRVECRIEDRFLEGSTAGPAGVRVETPAGTVHAPRAASRCRCRAPPDGPSRGRPATTARPAAGRGRRPSGARRAGRAGG